MRRRVVGMEVGDDGASRARLACGHLVSAGAMPRSGGEARFIAHGEGEDTVGGDSLECSLCDEAVWPRGLEPYKRTASFSAASVPAGLLSSHRTKEGVWARIHVEHGRLEYVQEEPRERIEVLEPGDFGTVLPEASHRVRPLGEVTFHVEFWRAPRS